MEAFRQYRRLQASVRSDDSKQDSDSPVDFTEHDENNPQNWSTSYKVFCTTIIWLLTLVTGWSSAADSTAHEIADKDLHVSAIAETLATSMFLFGVGACAIFTGPVSETLGRLPTYLGTFAVYLIWTMATALSPNFAAQIVFRFLAGFFASTSMSIYGGSLADMFDEDDRAWVWPVFALSPLLGPVLAPIASGWIVDCAGWRWIDWTTLIISGATFVVAVLFLPETSAPVILSYKAQILRKETWDENYKSEHDQGSASGRLSRNLSRIVYFITRESTTMLLGLYLTLLYLLIYGFLEGFDFLFTKTYGFTIGQRYSCFGSIAIGIFLGMFYVMILNRFTKTTGKPEQRLVPAIYASPLLTISLFWIGWTDRPSISYWSVLGACCLFGFSLHALFTTTYHYLLDTYGTVASSAMAALTCVRYLASGGMVLATEPMYKALTVKWTLTLLGCVAAVMTPMPWIFWKYGPTVRRRSKWARSEEKD